MTSPGFMVELHSLAGPVVTRRPRWRTPAAAVVVLLLLAGAWPYNLLMLRVVREDHLGDFGRLYYSARQFDAGRSLYGESPVDIGTSGRNSLFNLNPPHAHIPFLLLGRLSEATVFAVGLGLGLLSLLVCVRMGLVAAGHRSWLLVAGTAFLAPALAPAQAVVGTGQFFAWWLAIPALFAWRAARRNAWNESGAWLGVLAAVKPFALLFLPYLIVSRRWRAAGIFTAVIAGTIAAGVAVYGVHSYVEWVQSLRQSTWFANRLNGSFLAWCERLFGRTHVALPTAPDAILTYGPLWSARWLVQPLSYGLSALIGALTLWLSRRADSDHAFVLLVAAALLISPLGWTYYLWLAAAPLVVLVVRDSVFRRAAAAVVPFALWPIHLIRIGQPSPLATLTIGSASFWLVFGLWFAVALSIGNGARFRRPAAFVA